MNPYVIAFSWLGVQTPTADDDVVSEVPSEGDEGAYNIQGFNACTFI